MAEPFIVPMVAIHPNRINIYSEVNWDGVKPRRNPSKYLLGVSNAHKGKVSKVAKRKIGKAIEYLLFLAGDKRLPDTPHGKFFKFKLSFITLTLPSVQIHSDNEIKEKCLNHFLIEARKKWNVRNYIWRAEKQKNGNLHFHILTDRFIPWSEMRDCWNRIVNKLDYVNRYRDEMRKFHEGGFKVRAHLLKNWEYKAQIKAYKKGKANDWNSPNSTDIHAVYKIRDIKAYISKYCTKDEQNEGLIGRLWGCNQELSSIPGAQLVRDSQVDSALTALFDKYNPDVYNGEYFTTCFISFDMLQDPCSAALFNAFASFLNNHFSYNLQKYIPDG